MNPNGSPSSWGSGTIERLINDEELFVVVRGSGNLAIGECAKRRRLHLESERCDREEKTISSFHERLSLILIDGSIGEMHEFIFPWNLLSDSQALHMNYRSTQWLCCAAYSVEVPCLIVFLGIRSAWKWLQGDVDRFWRSLQRLASSICDIGLHYYQIFL